MINSNAATSLRQLFSGEVKSAKLLRLIKEMEIAEFNADYVQDSPKKSRRDAAHFRSLVLDMAGHRCEACSFDSGAISEVHHVLSVEHGGSGFPENLICLCPNCHSVVTALQRARSSQRTAVIEQWLRSCGDYKEEQRRFLWMLSQERVELGEEGTWQFRQ